MILLDTHVWIWFVSNPENLSETARMTIEETISKKSIYISSISTWELALLVNKNRIQLTMSVEDWVAKSEGFPFFKFIPVNNKISIKSVNLPPPFHADPADRIIIATAIIEGIPIVTKDQKIINYQQIQTVW